MNFSLKKISWSKGWHRVFLVWLKHYKIAFFLFFLVVAGFGGYQWRQSLYEYRWSDVERQAYLDATVKETSFQEEKFLSVLRALEEVRQGHEKTLIPAKELFIGAEAE